MSEPRVMTDAAMVRRFLEAGNAVITIKSQRTGQHYTYQVQRAADSGVPVFDDHPMFFVSVLTSGGDRDFTYVGILDRRAPNLRRTKKSKFHEDAPCVVAFRYFYAGLQRGVIAPQLEVRHEGNCGRCGRELTHPDSIDRGIGPDCAALMGIL